MLKTVERSLRICSTRILGLKIGLFGVSVMANTNIFDDHVRHIQDVVPNPDDIFEILKDIEWYPFPLRKGANSKRTLCNHNIQQSSVGVGITRWLKLLFRTMNVEVEVVGMFGNYYPDGNATLPHHQDKYNTEVISLSFGARRLFHFKDGFNGKVVKPTFYMSNGDMIIFDEFMNQNYWHGIPQQKQVSEPRINITCFAKFTGNPFATALDRSQIPTLEIPTLHIPTLEIPALEIPTLEILTLEGNGLSVDDLIGIMQDRSTDTATMPMEQMSDELLALYLQSLEVDG